MIIDFHTHTFPGAIAPRAVTKLMKQSHTVPYTDATESGLLSSMKHAGIDCSVILPVATAPRQVRHVNDASAALNATQKDSGLFSLGAMHPDYPEFREELRRISELGLRGIKLHPVYQGVDLNDPKFLRILDTCAELGLLAVTHAGDDIGFPGVRRCTPAMVQDAARTIGSGNKGYHLILAHMGGWRCWEEVLDRLPGTDVMIDTAFSVGAFEPLPDGYWKEGETGLLTEEKCVEMIRAFGANHVLFGTDSPWSDQKQYRELIEGLPLEAEEKKAVLGENALRILQEGQIL